MIERVIINAISTNIFTKLILAVDSIDTYNKLFDLTKKYNIGMHVVKHKVSCGSERAYYIHTAYESMGDYYDYYVTIPADEPFIIPKNIKKTWNKFLKNHNKEHIFTLYSKFNYLDRIKSKLSCKIVFNSKNEALYFSRSIIPIRKNGTKLHYNEYNKHLGIFIFHNDFLKKNKLLPWKKNDLALIEGLEQNAFLYNGFTIKMLKTNHPFYGVDSKNMIKKLARRVRVK